MEVQIFPQQGGGIWGRNCVAQYNIWGDVALATQKWLN